MAGLEEEAAAVLEDDCVAGLADGAAVAAEGTPPLLTDPGRFWHGWSHGSGEREIIGLRLVQSV